MDLDRYQELAGRTSAPPSTPMMNRLGKYLPEILGLLKSMRSFGERLNVFKRYVWYNKTAPDLPRIPDRVPLYPETHELSKNETANLRRMHALVGLATELAEKIECMQDPTFDPVLYEEELGDFLWYLAEAANASGMSLGQIAEKNINKLRVRYPEKYTDTDAVQRDLAAERKALETENR